MESRLNTVDRQDVVHAVCIQPTPIKMGRTYCMKQFTWPLYSEVWSAARWMGTDLHVTCIECVVSCP